MLETEILIFVVANYCQPRGINGTFPKQGSNNCSEGICERSLWLPFQFPLYTDSEAIRVYVLVTIFLTFCPIEIFGWGILRMYIDRSNVQKYIKSPLDQLFATIPRTELF